MDKRTWLRGAVNMVIVVAAIGAASESRFIRDGVDGSAFPLPSVEQILYAQEDAPVESRVLGPMSPEALGQCWMVCECQCSDRLCTMYCGIQCQPTSWQCQHKRGESLEHVPALESIDCI